MLTTEPVTATLVWGSTDQALSRVHKSFLDMTMHAQAANVVSVAIAAGMTIDNLAAVDLRSSQTLPTQS